MATWKGKPKKFSVEVCGPSTHWDLQWADVDFRWEYNTTSDTLSIFAEHPVMDDPKQKEPQLYSQEWAAAYLYTLASFYATYEGKEDLKELLKDLLEEEK